MEDGCLLEATTRTLREFTLRLGQVGPVREADTIVPSHDVLSSYNNR